MRTRFQLDYFFKHFSIMLMAFFDFVHYVDGDVAMLMAKYLRKSSARASARTLTTSGYWSHLVGIVNPAPRCGELAAD